MIVFYNKKTGDIIGTVNGRAHDKHTLDNFSISVEGMDKSDIGKYVVPYAPVEKNIEVPIKELRVKKGTMKVIEVIVGKRTVRKTLELTPDVSFKDKILDFESGKEDIMDHKIKLDKDGTVLGFDKKAKHIDS
jgi:hypothetical protein